MAMIHDDDDDAAADDDDEEEEEEDDDVDADVWPQIWRKNWWNWETCLPESGICMY